MGRHEHSGNCTLGLRYQQSCVCVNAISHSEPYKFKLSSHIIRRALCFYVFVLRVVFQAWLKL